RERGGVVGGIARVRTCQNRDQYSMGTIRTRYFRVQLAPRASSVSWPPESAAPWQSEVSMGTALRTPISESKKGRALRPVDRPGSESHEGREDPALLHGRGRMAHRIRWAGPTSGRARCASDS